MHNLELKIPPLIIAAACAIDMWLLAWLIPVGHYQLEYRTLLVGVPLVIGVVLPLLGARAFRRANTTVDPRYPEATEVLVTQGIYQFTRNPMYVGFGFLLIALGNYLEHAWAWVMVPIYIAYITHYQIKPEERRLGQRFGATYTQYCQQVRRWI